MLEQKVPGVQKTDAEYNNSSMLGWFLECPIILLVIIFLVFGSILIQVRWGG